MKIIVDKMPKSPSACPFSRVREREMVCLLDGHSPISSCPKTNYCPYLITFDACLEQLLKKSYYNGML